MTMRFSLALCFLSTPLVADLSDTIAQVIYNGLPTYSDAYMEGLARGLTAEKEATPSINQHELHPVTIEWLDQAYANLASAERLCSALSADTSYQELYPGCLFVRVLEEGHGQPIRETSAAIQVSATIYAMEENGPSTPLTELRHQSLPLDDIIPGLAYGVLGMKIGETRQVIIHPDLAYGYTSNFEPERAISIRITLHKIEPGYTHLSPVSPLAQLPDRDDRIDLEPLLEQTGFADGQRCRRHFYNLQNHPPFAQVASALQDLHRGLWKPEPLEPATVAKLHWEVQLTR